MKVHDIAYWQAMAGGGRYPAIYPAHLRDTESGQISGHGGRKGQSIGHSVSNVRCIVRYRA